MLAVPATAYQQSRIVRYQRCTLFLRHRSYAWAAYTQSPPLVTPLRDPLRLLSYVFRPRVPILMCFFLLIRFTDLSYASCARFRI